MDASTDPDDRFDFGTIPDDLMREFGKAISKWRWIRVDGQQAHDVTLEHDGGKITRLDYRGDFARADVLDVIFRDARNRRDRRKAGAKKGAETRQRRRSNRDYTVARKIVEGRFQRSGNCACCGRPLTDPESIRRGIGPECWEVVKSIIEEITRAK